MDFLETMSQPALWVGGTLGIFGSLIASYIKDYAEKKFEANKKEGKENQRKRTEIINSIVKDPIYLNIAMFRCITSIVRVATFYIIFSIFSSATILLESFGETVFPISILLWIANIVLFFSVYNTMSRIYLISAGIRIYLSENGLPTFP